MLDLYVTPIAEEYEKRSIPITGFKTLKFFVLSKEDIIVSKLGRYSEKDKADIEILIKKCNLTLLDELIENVVNRKNFSNRIKEEFIKNSNLIRKIYNVQSIY